MPKSVSIIATQLQLPVYTTQLGYGSLRKVVQHIATTWQGDLATDQHAKADQWLLATSLVNVESAACYLRRISALTNIPAANAIPAVASGFSEAS